MINKGGATNTNPTIRARALALARRAKQTQPQPEPNKKTIFQRMVMGAKEGLAMNILPDHILKIENKIYVKIFKGIGAFCVYLSVTKLSYNFSGTITCLIYAISFLYIIYMYVIIFYVIKQFILDFKNGKLLIRNSPLDNLASAFKIFLRTTKSTAKVTFGTGVSYALAKELDDILEEEGKDPYFIPKIHKAIWEIPGLKENLLKFAVAIGIKDSIKLTRFEKIREHGTIINGYIKSLEPEEIEEIEKNDLETLAKFSEIFSDLNKNKTKSISEEVQKMIERDDPFKTK
jgi:hypothetical protein